MPIDKQDLRPGEEDALRGLLQKMAPEVDPAPEVRERIRQAVAAEWRSAVTPARRWPRPALALAAGLVAGAVALGIFLGASPTPVPTIASLTRVSGPVEAHLATGWQPVSAGQALAAGQHLVTGPRGKAALILKRGITLRLDANTRIAMTGIDRVVVERGAVYLDAGQRPTAGPGVRIDSAFGSTRHLGTQYEVRVMPTAMHVSVREGRVELTGNSPSRSPVVAQAGEQLVIGTTGAVARRTIDRRDAGWNWIAEVTPPYAIEERRLAEFLGWVCRETGRELAFASPEVQAVAETVILRGSVAGLSPDAALAAVMATTNLSSSEENGRLVVQRALR